MTTWVFNSCLSCGGSLTVESLASSVRFSQSVVSDSLQPHGLQRTGLCCPSLTLRACSNSCPLSQWCHPTISSSVVPFSSCPQSFPASRSFPMSQFFASGGQRIGVSASASVLPVNIPLGWTGWISLQSKGLQVQIVRIQLNARSPSWYPENCLVVWGKFHRHNWNWVQNSK